MNWLSTQVQSSPPSPSWTRGKKELWTWVESQFNWTSFELFELYTALVNGLEILPVFFSVFLCLSPGVSCGNPLTRTLQILVWSRVPWSCPCGRPRWPWHGGQTHSDSAPPYLGGQLDHGHLIYSQLQSHNFSICFANFATVSPDSWPSKAWMCGAKSNATIRNIFPYERVSEHTR